MSQAVAKPTYDELMALVQRKNEEIAALQAKGQRTISFKIGEKGAISVYGLGRFPTTLYASQWEALFTQVPALQKFIADNADKVARKTA